MPYKISILHPSRNRPLQAEKTIKEWLGNAKHPEEIEYILSVDKDDKDLRRYRSVGFNQKTFVAEHKNRSAIDAINKAAKVSTANIIIVVSDDFGCFPGWDEALLKEVEGKEDFILKTQDGIQEWIITLPLMDRAYYNRFGYIYYPEYKHLFCDTEMTSVGDILGRTIKSNLYFEHRHHTVGKSRRDVVNVKNDKTWKQGETLYNARKKINFGL